MKEIVFKEAKPNHFYSQRNTNGQLELIKDPEIGKKYYEVAVISGGSID